MRSLESRCDLKPKTIDESDHEIPLGSKIPFFPQSFHFPSRNQEKYITLVLTVSEFSRSLNRIVESIFLSVFSDFHEI